jgi:hypothetical protein
MDWISARLSLLKHFLMYTRARCQHHGKRKRDQGAERSPRAKLSHGTNASTFGNNAVRLDKCGLVSDSNQLY